MHITTNRIIIKFVALVHVMVFTSFTGMDLSFATAGALNHKTNELNLSSVPNDLAIAGVGLTEDSKIKILAGQRPATREEAERLGALVMKFYNQDADNPHAATYELSEVRKEMIHLQENGVRVSFNVLHMEDHELRGAIYKSLQTQVAAGKFTNAVHALLVCIGMIACSAGGPGPTDYPDLNDEARIHHTVRGTR